MKRRDKLDGRAKGRTGSLWAPGRLGKCIGCGPPDTFEKYRHRGTGVPATPPGHRERRAGARVGAGRTVFLVSGRRARGRGRGARRGERSVRLPPGLLGRAPLSRRIEYTNRRVPLYTSRFKHCCTLLHFSYVGCESTEITTPSLPPYMLIGSLIGRIAITLNQTTN